MKATLVLCVKNGNARLQNCLDHIDRLNGPDDLEVILVDNDSSDTSFKSMSAFAETSRFNCQLMQSMAPGNGAGRNSAIKKSTGDLLLFIDGDCYVDPDLVKDWLDIFSAKDIGFASGRIMRLKSDDSMVGCNESPTEQFVDAQDFVPRGFIQGSNMAFRRSCLECSGLFDEKFGAGTPFAGEEWELALRASFAGFSGGYFPRPHVVHDHQRANCVARERQLYYDYGAGAVYAKHMFGSRYPTVIRKFIGDVRWLEDWGRKRKLLRGWGDYQVFRLKDHL